MEMSLRGLRPTRIKAGRVISAFKSSIHPLAEPIESPLRGNLLEGRTRSGELTRHVIPATEASDTAPTPPNYEELWTGRNVTKHAGPRPNPHHAWGLGEGQASSKD